MNKQLEIRFIVIKQGTHTKNKEEWNFLILKVNNEGSTINTHSLSIIS